MPCVSQENTNDLTVNAETYKENNHKALHVKKF
jgi:hypothetical protein